MKPPGDGVELLADEPADHFAAGVEGGDPCDREYLIGLFKDRPS